MGGRTPTVQKRKDTMPAKRFPASNDILPWTRRGLPHAVAVTTTDVADRNGALAAMDRCKPNLESVQSVLVDGGYTGLPFADSVMERLKATVQVVKRNELHTFAVLPKRWIVERCFGWLEKCRRLWKNCERKLNTSLQFVHLAFLVLLLRRS